MAIKILVVDDEQAIVESLSEILRDEGYEVLPACSPKDAILVASENCPALLLSDVLMPRMNGFELALELKKICPSCRILLFSGQAATAQLAQKYSQTFSRLGHRFELLPKPLHPAALLQKLEQTLSYAA